MSSPSYIHKLSDELACITKQATTIYMLTITAKDEIPGKKLDQEAILEEGDGEHYLN
jgi:hypothetical protein